MNLLCQPGWITLFLVRPLFVGLWEFVDQLLGEQPFSYKTSYTLEWHVWDGLGVSYNPYINWDNATGT